MRHCTDFSALVAVRWRVLFLADTRSIEIVISVRRTLTPPHSCSNCCRGHSAVMGCSGLSRSIWYGLSMAFSVTSPRRPSPRVRTAEYGARPMEGHGLRAYRNRWCGGQAGELGLQHLHGTWCGYIRYSAASCWLCNECEARVDWKVESDTNMWWWSHVFLPNNHYFIIRLEGRNAKQSSHVMKCNMLHTTCGNCGCK